MSSLPLAVSVSRNAVALAGLTPIANAALGGNHGCRGARVEREAHQAGSSGTAEPRIHNQQPSF
jgi:hypothetical protein